MALPYYIFLNLLVWDVTPQNTATKETRPGTALRGISFSSWGCIGRILLVDPSCNGSPHGCHRYHLSKLPDFSLIKIQFPWVHKYKISDLVGASGVNLKPSFPLIQRKHFQINGLILTQRQNETRKWPIYIPVILIELPMHPVSDWKKQNI